MLHIFNEGKEFHEDEPNNPLRAFYGTCQGMLCEVMKDDNMPYKWWVFQNPDTKEYMACWDIGNGWWSGEYYTANSLSELGQEILKNVCKEKQEEDIELEM